MAKNTLRQKAHAMSIIETYIEGIELSNGTTLSAADRAYILKRAQERVTKTNFLELKERQEEMFQRLNALLELAGLDTSASIVEE
jgi:hypothetical protein